jgi:hypothetical protein
MLIIDVSGSTREPSGVDIDGNGVVGQLVHERTGLLGRSVSGSSDPGDSILAAEVAAGHRLLARLDPATTRVGVVSFSGPDGKPAAHLDQPLTDDFEAVGAALRRILAGGSFGGTDMAAGIRLAVRELAGLQGHVSPRAPGGRKAGILLTDGFPTLPFGDGQARDHRDVEVAVAAAGVAARAGIAIHTFGLGEQAASAPEASMEIARSTGGRYTPIATPGDIVELIQRTSFSGVDILLLRNATTGQPAANLTVTADGAFRGDVPLAPGSNRIAVEVLTTDGKKVAAGVTVHYRPQASLDLQLRRNRELELQVESLRQRTRALEEAAERQRRLELEIRRTP